VPFLNRTILIDLLKTYRGAAQIEEKYDSLINEQKQTPSTFLQLMTEQSVKFKNTSSRFLGYNSAEDSEACYLELRALIDDATQKNNIEAWADILCTAGEGGFQTYSKSVIQSNLGQTSFALLMYVRGQIADKVASIENPETTTDKEEILALQINDSIKTRAAETKEFILSAKDNLERSTKLKLSSLYANKFKINVDEGQNFCKYSMKMLEVAQRHLLFLGDESIKNDEYLQSAQSLFEMLPFYSSELQKKYHFSENQIRNLKLHLPMYLQDIYPSLHIRNNRKDLENIKEERKVIKSFEELSLIKDKQQIKQKLSQEQKESPATISSNLDGFLRDGYADESKQTHSIFSDSQKTPVASPSSSADDSSQSSDPERGSLRAF